ncbi:protein FAR1-RELATED SEQUENCE 5-like [Amborella trichopoda]|uniref:protein FAR1-RELATED SEQUENCE 5-like n=1 Tax=Amborella trichopoda TaxID=13333 RepID=UPI0005D36DCC|nr:protein FAR1-RELATED SEQUENCE 5-like [Amborella trichopoda]|eukprot:XP_011624317.1 protein FAR1-RELATED SEQUENCE 5-like [Amborella trichopoda]
MAFTNEDEAYDYYNKYVKLVEFGIRKERTIWKHGGRISRILEYCRQGFRSEMYDGSENARPHTKYGCQAKICIKKNENNRWVIAKVVKEHNHILTTPNITRFIRSHRKIPNTVKRVIDTMESSMAKSRVMMNYLVEEVGRAENVTLIAKDLENHITRKKKQLKGKEGNVVMNWLHTKNELDPNFFYRVRLDEMGRSFGVLSVDSKCRSSYQFFNDVVTFDTIYQTNEYSMAFGPILGVNHHANTIFLVCDLIFNETTETFIWLFEN